MTGAGVLGCRPAARVLVSRNWLLRPATRYRESQGSTGTDCADTYLYPPVLSPAVQGEVPVPRFLGRSGT